MSALFEELDYRATPIGALSLRRRRELRLGVDVFEIKLGAAPSPPAFHRAMRSEPTLSPPAESQPRGGENGGAFSRP